MLHVSICCKSFISQVPLKGTKGMESLGPILPKELLIGYCAMARKLWTILPTVLLQHLIIFACLDSTRSTWPNKRFATDTDMQQAVTSWLWTLNTEFLYAGIQPMQPQWDECLYVNDDHVET